MKKFDKEKEKLFKNISCSIITKELKDNNLENNIYPIRYITYYKNVILKSKERFKDKIKEYFYSKDALGANIFNYTFIFIDRFNMFNTLDEQILELVFTSYHEARHIIQHSFDEYSYDRFLNTIDRIYKGYINSTDYNYFHDDYSFEIGANLYAINKTKQYLKEHYQDIYNRKIDELNEREDKYVKDYFVYSPLTRTKMVIDLVQREKKMDLIPIMKHFMNEDGTFKNLKEIMNDRDYGKIDKKIIYSIISLKEYLNTLDMKKLPENEKNLLIEALKFHKIITINSLENIEKYSDELNSIKTII